VDQKIWGETELVFDSFDVTVHVLRVKKGGVCSWHYHERKYNRFYVISGRFAVRFLFGGLQTGVVLQPGESHTICPGPGHLHEFEALEDSVVVETCFVKDERAIDPNDIHRLRLGYYKSPSGMVFGCPGGWKMGCVNNCVDREMAMAQFTCDQCPLFDIVKEICELTGDPENPESIACIDSPLRKLEKKVVHDLQPFVGQPNTEENRARIKQLIEQSLLDYYKAFVEQMVNEGWSRACRGNGDEPHDT